MKNIYDLLNNLDAGKAEAESFERVDMTEDEQDKVMKYILGEKFNSRTTKKKKIRQTYGMEEDGGCRSNGVVYRWTGFYGGCRSYSISGT